jgi:hypothetical protein
MNAGRKRSQTEPRTTTRRRSGRRRVRRCCRTAPLGRPSSPAASSTRRRAARLACHPDVLESHAGYARNRLGRLCKGRGSQDVVASLGRCSDLVPRLVGGDERELHRRWAGPLWCWYSTSRQSFSRSSSGSVVAGPVIGGRRGEAPIEPPSSRGSQDCVSSRLSSTRWDSCRRRGRGLLGDRGLYRGRS